MIKDVIGENKVLGNPTEAIDDLLVVTRTPSEHLRKGFKQVLVTRVETYKVSNTILEDELAPNDLHAIELPHLHLGFTQLPLCKLKEFVLKRLNCRETLRNIDLEEFLHEVDERSNLSGESVFPLENTCLDVFDQF